MQNSVLDQGHEASEGIAVRSQGLSKDTGSRTDILRNSKSATRQERSHIDRRLVRDGASAGGRTVHSVPVGRQTRGDGTGLTALNADYIRSRSQGGEGRVNLSLSVSWLQKLVDFQRLLHEIEQLPRSSEYSKILPGIPGASSEVDAPRQNQSSVNSSGEGDHKLPLRNEHASSEPANQIGQKIMELLEEESVLGVDGTATSVIKSLALNHDPRGFYTFHEHIGDRASSLNFSNNRSPTSESHSDIAQVVPSDKWPSNSRLDTSATSQLFEFESQIVPRKIQHSESGTPQDYLKIGSWATSIIGADDPPIGNIQFTENNTINKTEACIDEIWVSASLSWTKGPARLNADHIDYLYVHLWLLANLVAFRIHRLIMGYILQKTMKQIRVSIEQYSGRHWARVVEDYWFRNRETVSTTQIETSINSTLQAFDSINIADAETTVTNSQITEAPAADTYEGRVGASVAEPDPDTPKAVKEQVDNYVTQPSATASVDQKVELQDPLLNSSPAKNEESFNPSKSLASTDNKLVVRRLNENGAQLARDGDSNATLTAKETASRKASSRAPARTSEIPGIGDAFRAEGRWYARTSERNAQGITPQQAHKIRAERKLMDNRKVIAPTHSIPEYVAYDNVSGPGIPNTTKTGGHQYNAVPSSHSARNLEDKEHAAPKNLTPQNSASRISDLVGNKPIKDQKEPTQIRNSPRQKAASPMEVALKAKLHPSGKKKFECLSGTIVYFVLIPEGDFSQLAEFLTENPELLRFNLTKLYSEAVAQTCAGDLKLARQCITCLVIIRLCENLTSKQELIDIRVRALADSTTAIANEFYEKFAAVEKDVRSIVDSERSRSSTRSDRRRVKRVPVKSPESRKEEIVNLNESQSSANERRRPTRADTKKDRIFPTMRELEDDISENISQLIGKAPGPISIDSADLENPEVQKLSADFKVRDQAGRFFIPGRVFAVLWHESVEQASKANKTAIDLAEPSDGYMESRLKRQTAGDSLGQQIYTHIRRFVVVRSRPAYCWCISLNTYGGRGLKRKGMKRAEIDAHTIIYDDAARPEYLPGEPETGKSPIAVKLKPGQSLSKATRLHYGKPSTIEFTMPVRNIGTVRKDHMVILLSDVRNEIFGG